MTTTNFKSFDWNVIVSVPDDYANNKKTYPAMIFFPGAGELGTDINRLKQNGIHARLQSGWDGKPLSMEFIYISIQPIPEHPAAADVKKRIDDVIAKYRIGGIWLTGLSRGAWNSYQLSVNFPSSYRGVISVEGQPTWTNAPGDGAAQYSGNIIKTYKPVALSGQKYLIYHNNNGLSRNDEIANAMNAAVPGSAVYMARTFGGGGHTGWSQVYGAKNIEPARFIEIENMNIYEWMAKTELELQQNTTNPDEPESPENSGNPDPQEPENPEPPATQIEIIVSDKHLIVSDGDEQIISKDFDKLQLNIL